MFGGNVCVHNRTAYIETEALAYWHTYIINTEALVQLIKHVGVQHQVSGD